jgi:eukaryotic-like serine/threonine-protein kinase
MLRLETFGGLTLVSEPGAKSVTQRRRLALLALLAVARDRGFSRDKLMAYLWPESPANNARHALEQLLYELRRQLGDALFLGTDPLRLNPELIASDVAAFEGALAAGALDDAVALYRGPFIDGFFLSDAPEFEQWAEAERNRLARVYADAVYRLARQRSENAHHTDAIALWRKLSAAEPLSGRAAFGLMRALAAAGDRVGALQSARAYEALVRAELQADPDPAVATLLRELQSPGSAAVGTANPTGSPSPVAEPRPDRPSGLEGVRAALAERYAIEGMIQHGGMATIYRARDLRLHRTVAIKVLRSEVAQAVRVERFLREIEVASRLQHPLILPIFDSGSTESSNVPFLWYAMPYVEGESLRERLVREKQLPPDDAVRIACDVADALASAHARGVVHRDVKPENILLSGGHAILADFGIAQALRAAGSERLTETGIAIGTPGYMSPEQAGDGDRVDGRSDLYALGCVLYEMLAGQPPFVASTAQGVLARHAVDPVPSLRTLRPSVPVELEAAIERVLRKVPADRFATAEAFAHAVRTAATARSSRPRRALAYGAAALLLVVALVGALWLRQRGAARATAAPREPSVAVLPLNNLTADPHDAALADGMTDELIAVLASVGKLRVIASTSAFAFRNSRIDVRRIADSLRVAYIIEGGVGKVGSRLRVQVRLVDGHDGSARWSETYDRELKDVFQVQDDIARSVAQELDVQLVGLTATQRLRHQTSNVAAYEFYLRGSDPVLMRSDSGLRLAADMFSRATAADSTYAAAYAGLARVLALRVTGGHAPVHETIARAEAAALHAVALDDSLAEAHRELGFVRMIGAHDLGAAEQELHRALLLDPGSGAQGDLGFLHVWTGQVGEALEEARRVVEADPLSARAIREVARALWANHRYDDALAELRAIASVRPPIRGYHEIAGLCYMAKRMWPEAVAVLRQGADLGDDRVTALLGYALARSGARTEATRMLSDLLMGWRRGSTPAFSIALTYAGLGDLDQAFLWLDRALDEGLVAYYLMGPGFEDLRRDPRFERIRRRLGIQNR